MGNHFFVTKRYVFSRCSEDELLARVKRRIRPPNEAQAEPTIVHGEVALDLLTRRLTAAGIEHDRTAREFTMPEFFLRHPRQVIPRKQLLSRVWGLGCDLSSKVVEFSIRYLGRKLSNNLDQSVRGTRSQLALLLVS